MQFIFVVILAVIAPLLLTSPSTATPTATTNTRHGICHKEENGVFLPMQGSCSGFYMCLDGGAVASSCGPFYRFNAATGVCDHPDLVECHNERPSPNEVRPIEHDDDDFIWVMPILPVMPTTDTSMVSPPGFPAHLPKPQSPEEAIYDEAAGDICEYQRNGVLLPKADSCAHFYVCLMRRPYRRSCPPMLHFNAEKRLCQAPALAQCMTQSFDNPLVLELVAFAGNGKLLTCAAMPDGILLPHDSTCEKFVNCEGGERIEMDCPQGLHFSLRHQRCEWPKLARCSV